MGMKFERVEVPVEEFDRILTCFEKDDVEVAISDGYEPTTRRRLTVPNPQGVAVEPELLEVPSSLALPAAEHSHLQSLGILTVAALALGYLGYRLVRMWKASKPADSEPSDAEDRV